MQLPIGNAFAPPRFGRPHVSSARQALVQICIADTCDGSEFAAPLGCDFRLHDADCSESLWPRQAIRLHFPLRSPLNVLLEQPDMETIAARRKRKLMQLCASNGGHVAVAKAAGVSAAAIDQILKGVPLPAKKDGSRSERALGSMMARALESAFGLGVGWFDADDPPLVLTDDERALILAYRQHRQPADDSDTAARLRKLMEQSRESPAIPVRRVVRSLTDRRATKKGSQQ